MKLAKWFFVVLGMGILFHGLHVQSIGILQNQPDDLDFALSLYILGSVLLVVPPVIEFRTAENRVEKEFAKLLIVLEIFLVVSSLLFFWKGSLLGKIAVRIGASLMITCYLKYGLKQLPEFCWQFYLNPLLLFRYFWDCFKGKYGPAYPLSLGIDCLGLGYAFLEYPFGKGALLLGSAFLLISAWRGYRATGAAIPMAWSMLNLVYVAYGAFFFVHALIHR